MCLLHPSGVGASPLAPTHLRHKVHVADKDRPWRVIRRWRAAAAAAARDVLPGSGWCRSVHAQVQAPKYRHVLRQSACHRGCRHKHDVRVARRGAAHVQLAHHGLRGKFGVKRGRDSEKGPTWRASSLRIMACVPVRTRLLAHDQELERENGRGLA
eukprot:350100-Chlamydomonas_euryale.AAC.3